MENKLKEIYNKLSTPEEKLEDLLELIDPEKLRGEPGKNPTEEELLEIIKPLIPNPIKGDDGKTPTQDELLEMIKSLIPPAIPGKDGNIITPEEIRDKLNELKGVDRLSVLSLKDLEWLKSKEGMQWSSAGFKIYTDSSLTGDGTFSNPLKATAVSENYKNKVSATDTTPDYLNPKITVSGGLVKTITNPGGDEGLNIDGGTLSKSFVHKYPVSTSKHILQKAESAYTITSLDIFVTGGTSITGRLVEYDTDGTLIQVISADITATTGIDSVTTSFINPIVASSKKIGWEVTAVVGAVEEISVTYFYTK